MSLPREDERLGGGRENERHVEKRNLRAWDRKWCKGKILDEVSC